MDHTNLEHIAQRAYRYEHASGLSEITIGGLLLFGAVALQFGYSILGLDDPNDSLLPILSAALLIALVALGAWAFAKGINAVKERFVYPRTGYVQYRIDDAERRRFSYQVLLLGIALAALLSPYGNNIFLMLGLLLGYGLLFYGRKTGLTRFYVEAFVVVMAAFALPLTGIDRLDLNVVYLAAIGLVLLIAGGYAFWRYLTRFQVQDQQL
ncbi:MAG: hypothetical protein AAGU78_13200 [Chloroflexota bacterium]|nr:hypothetical protein [Aggregatilineaceae bacterium]